MGEDWNDSTQSKEQVEAKMQSRQEAAMRRERALAYSFSHQVRNSSPGYIQNLKIQTLADDFSFCYMCNLQMKRNQN
jgi:hypothetical protein